MAEDPKSGIGCMGVVTVGTALGILAVTYYTSDMLKRAEENQPAVQVKNVIGNEQPETFYEINGQRAYLTIDGKTIENYVGER